MEFTIDPGSAGEKAKRKFINDLKRLLAKHDCWGFIDDGNLVIDFNAKYNRKNVMIRPMFSLNLGGFIDESETEHEL